MAHAFRPCIGRVLHGHDGFFYSRAEEQAHCGFEFEGYRSLSSLVLADHLKKDSGPRGGENVSTGTGGNASGRDKEEKDRHALYVVRKSPMKYQKKLTNNHGALIHQATLNNKCAVCIGEKAVYTFEISPSEHAQREE